MNTVDFEAAKFCSPEAVASGAQEFAANAYYDESMDCVRVRVKDASVTEHRINKLITILVENYTEECLVVGFTIKGVHELSSRLGLAANTAIAVTDLLDQVIGAYPDETMQVVHERVGTLLEGSDLKVELPQAA